jgi:hypothetical protein
MTKSEKLKRRVDLARDVLAQLDAKKFIAAHCGYLDYRHKGQDLCGVCALGAMVVSCCGVESTIIGSVQVSRCLEPLFGEEELGLIEAAFEGGSDYPFAQKCDDYGFGNVEDAVAMFGEREDGSPDDVGAETRLRGIMEHLIEHGGEFRP